MLKKLLIAFGLLAAPLLAHANPIRYTQISSAPFSVQGGSVNVQGISVSTVTVKNQILLPGTSGQILISAGPGVPAFFSGGRILQIVSSQTTISKTSASGTYADTGLQATITPLYTTSKVIVIVTQHSSMATNATQVTLKLLRAGSDITPVTDYTALDSAGTVETHVVATLVVVDSPSSTSSLLYKTQFSRFSGTGTAGVNTGNAGNPGASTITLIEVSQ